MCRSARRLAVLSCALLLAAVASVPTAAAGPDQDVIVVFRTGAGDPGGLAASLGRDLGFSTRYVYGSAIHGFAARVSAAALSALRANPNIESVELDGPVQALDTQSSATWGLDRIDQRGLPLSTTYVYNETGAGVTAYIIDTGIRVSHAEFGGRAVHGRDTVDSDNIADDCHGHGTHVAGTVGGATSGVAKGVSLVAVRVLNCQGSGTWAGVIAGIDWVTGNHTGTNPAVANMSLGGGASDAVDAAVTNSIADGVSYAVAAGNDNANACNSSPARTPNAMTIGATGSNDARASFSNFGSCVDWFAPGVSITSAWITTDTATNTISGTSMASPHAAGVAALYLGANPGATAATVRDALFTATTKGVVTSSSTTNNHLLYSLDLGTPGPTPTPTPTSTPTGNTGLLSPTANEAVTAGAGDGNGYESAPANAYTDGGGAAIDLNSGTNSASSCTSGGKDKHAYREFGVPAFPNGATIKGIEVLLDAWADSTSGSPRICVQVSWDGGLTWTAAKATATLGTTESTRTLGSSTDTWGRNWAVGDFLDANFRVRLSNGAGSTSRDFSLDWVAVRVSY